MPVTDRVRLPVPSGALNAGEHAVRDLIEGAHLLAAHQLPALLQRAAQRLGVDAVRLYLADVQQDVLVPFVGAAGPGMDQTVGSLAVDGTLAGRCYQLVEVLVQELPAGKARLWLPLLDGSERLIMPEPRPLPRAGTPATWRSCSGSPRSSRPFPRRGRSVSTSWPGTRPDTSAA